MTPERQSVVPARSPWLARAAAGGALLLGFVLVLVVLFGGDGGRKYHLLFDNGGQLVSGNEVLRAGQTIGTVDDVTLTDSGQAEVTISVDDALHQGTSAIIRATSLSGIANRYVSITPGPDNAPELEDGATLAGEKTTSPVDLDQLFNTLDAADAQGAPERDPGLRLALREQPGGRAADLQVLRARAVDGPAAVRRAEPRQPGAQPVPGPGLAGARGDRGAPRRPLGADPERQRVPGRDRAASKAPSTPRSRPSRRRFARRTPPSSTCARSSTT